METQHEKPPIVVGIDEKPESVIALRWAAEEAAATSSPLVLVHAFEWLAPVRLGRDDYPFPLRDEGLDKSARQQYEENARELLAEAAAIVAAAGTRLKVTTKTIEGPPFDVLNAECRNGPCSFSAVTAADCSAACSSARSATPSQRTRPVPWPSSARTPTPSPPRPPICP
ncbi:universal stress protein [Phytomonospora sp. NPDC050363]|uniref:universal stress protein n=1 Tax=Phytomonospora sp. NPDC050363 TaxID=3155642 RepID=UPI00340B7A20